MKKSRIIRLKTLITEIRQLTDLFYEDKITVYAAQASFFVIISAVPFLSLLIAVISIVKPTDPVALTESLQGLIPSPVLNAFAELIHELRDIPHHLSCIDLRPHNPLVSVQGNRGCPKRASNRLRRFGQTELLRGKLSSLIYTLCFMVMILTAVILLLFGDFLFEILSEKSLIASDFLNLLLPFKSPIFITLISLVFNTMYYVIGRRSKGIPGKFFFHLPGAVLAAAGWNVFSVLYSLYITHFPRAFSLYGGLTAICLIMLWLYFCMIILLVGAEANKIICQKRKSQK